MSWSLFVIHLEQIAQKSKTKRYMFKAEFLWQTHGKPRVKDDNGINQNLVMPLQCDKDKFKPCTGGNTAVSHNHPH